MGIKKVLSISVVVLSFGYSAWLFSTPLALPHSDSRSLAAIGAPAPVSPISQSEFRSCLGRVQASFHKPFLGVALPQCHQMAEDANRCIDQNPKRLTLSNCRQDLSDAFTTDSDQRLHCETDLAALILRCSDPRQGV